MASRLSVASPDVADLSACAREPIHAPGLIQPQGVLLVLSLPDLIVRQAAIGPGLTLALADPLLHPLASVLGRAGERLVARLQANLPLRGPLNLGAFDAGDLYQAVAHQSGDTLILELEVASPDDPTSFDEVYPHMQTFLGELQNAGTVDDLAQLAAREVRRIIGFDRALVYRFDEQSHGTVIAEDGNDVLPSYFGHRFPGEDIPAQARKLYLLNRLRLIADSDYEAVPIKAAHAGEPTPDLSLSILRSVAPVHLEYMRNMGTGASMSVSLIQGGKLWGLIACHNQAAKRVPYPARTACDFLGQILSLQIGARETASLSERRIALRSVQTRLLTDMTTAEDFAAALAGNPTDLLRLTDATGAAILFGGETHVVGQTPDPAALRQIVRWLGEESIGDAYATHHLPALMPEAAGWKDVASGVLAVPISVLHESYVLWFRPEVVQTVKWAGSPVKPNEVPEGARIHPRMSFDTWKETLRLQAIEWHDAEIEAALQLRGAIVDIVLRKAEELAALNEQLVRSNKELEAFSYSVSHDLRAPFRHIVGYSELLLETETASITERGHRYVKTIIESAVSAGVLVDNLLSFSQMGRTAIHPVKTDINQLVAEALRRFAPDMAGRSIEWSIADLPPAFGDPTMLRLVIQNLLDNAIKFTAHEEAARVEVGHREANGETIYYVRDNGVGFDQAFVGKLFGVFQRLHRTEEFAGTGIGLANVKRIIELRHGGRVWAEGAPGEGATISFVLPPQRDA